MWASVRAMHHFGFILAWLQFIFISPSELELVAETIRKRGRISIAELAQISTELIDLQPKELDAPSIDFEEDAVVIGGVS